MMMNFFVLHIDWMFIAIPNNSCALFQPNYSIFFSGIT
jgi:hypothetical protein